MSKKPSKKKIVVPKKKVIPTTKKTIAPTVSRTKSSNISTQNQDPLLFGKQNYMLMGAGALLVALGLLLMTGGGMPDANTWDPNIIYGTRVTVLAPFVILIGLIVEVYAIFKR